MSHLVYQANADAVDIRISYGMSDTPENVLIRKALAPLILPEWQERLKALYAQERAIIAERQTFIASCRTTFDAEAEQVITTIRNDQPELFL